MKYLRILTIALGIIGCSEVNIDTLIHEELSFHELPSEVIECIEHPNDFVEERNSSLIELPKDTARRYKVESVKTWIGPWTSYLKLIDTKTNTYYEIDQGTPSPFLIYKDKLYIPNDFGVFTTTKDRATYQFKCYHLDSALD